MTYQRFPAPAKLNLTLSVVGRRADGYHLLETVFRFIDLCDDIELAVRTDGAIVLDTPLPGVPPESDLTVRAARALQQASGSPLGASIRVTKRIPMGGGLGGGSSDAATVLLALNRLWGCGFPRERLQAIGLTLGADVPVFVFGEAAFASGIGEELTPCEVPEAWYVVLDPGVSVPTAKIFSSTLLTRDSPISIMRSLSGATKRRNDLQAVVFQEFPQVARCHEVLSKYGEALMTGSGSCVFLECPTEQHARTVYRSVSQDYRGFVVKGLQRHPVCGID
ncbi:4-(cytidine 5'-diphospho)-2-C-methyl-D-erythritol kinase [Laribacter hongkongensis]|uniref:4-(cytidine 5'-diphospho)-2-C-methyl-D-erythritol kinase n=1 Tax=Laribacter hongkongensis TaxID=168471 RepID=UPI001EFCEEFA|nr:4-(cytidine 5'-diphospho)-2-C-methyl-D-erythritol kinase [Laribacter hongkongensis]MCG9031912.1 4-(cytidine 5'-diphospho)-2-C-methyl-D-erythritol kinase [Laribacter hongkongensis]MCG9081795.1 4-(cytidine 5'-diphospho)-2-C-methyl-D-erythritol kinase [Laribacter hongkongensis]MCG9091227.1 4-(cytidine 5'-diphospho)-2-C-methyl-D-erythritol kinase [Laribacter hongkongensis]